MKKFFLALVALAMVPALYAAEDTPIQNVCDSLSLGEQPVIELVPAYIEESNWYGNPQTWVKDSSNSTRHESYETVKVSISTKKTMQLPVSISASCRELPGQEVKYVKWNTHQEWEPYTEDDVETRIYTMRELSMNGHNETNTSNILAFVPGGIPQDYAFKSNQLLFSVTFEFAFEYWFASASYRHKTQSGTTTTYVTAMGNDSLKIVDLVVDGLAVPDTIKSIHIQTLKAVLVDSRKPLLPAESSSSETPVASSSSEEPAESSSSETPVASSSSEEPAESSSSETPVASSSSEEPAESSSSETPVISSSSEDVESSSSEAPETSSSAEENSSSSEGPTRLVTSRSLGKPAHVMQVRSLDGTIVKNTGRLAPGVYYVKDSDGKWNRMAVLPR